MLVVVTDNEVPEAGPDDIAFRLTWLPDGDTLKGELEARNVGERRVRLTGKPQLTPLDIDGRPLDTAAIITLELMLPGFVELDPGESATAADRLGRLGRADGRPAGAGRVAGRPGRRGHPGPAAAGGQRPGHQSVELVVRPGRRPDGCRRVQQAPRLLDRPISVNRQPDSSMCGSSQISVGYR